MTESTPIDELIFIARLDSLPSQRDSFFLFYLNASSVPLRSASNLLALLPASRGAPRRDAGVDAQAITIEHI
jgi:hypothetical protein